MQNYEVQPGHRLIFGSIVHEPGEVLPEWYVNRDGGVDGRVSSGALAPTDKRVSRQLEPPKAKTVADPAPALGQELNRVTAELNEALASNKSLVEQLDAAKKQGRGFELQLTEATKSDSHLRAVCEDHQKEIDRLNQVVNGVTAERDALKLEIARLTTDLDKATAPDAQATGEATKR